MDEITKLFRRIIKHDRILIEAVLRQIFSRKFIGLDIQKLKGYTHIYRVRVGNYRIFYYDDGHEIILKAIRRRNESTYRDF